ncbi:MAG: ammonia-forming cytochrome c nitrite reductase subunit c552 [Candidatus Thorarchaeota archaeon]
MVYYTDSPKINRRMVAGYYLFLCLVGFAVLLGPTGAGIPIAIISTDGRDHELAFPGTHDSPDDCNQSGCHLEEFAYWNQTAHATHMGSFTNGTGDYITIGDHWEGTEAFFNSTCSECHTTGWDNSTGTPTYDFLGVNCFACHNSTGSIDYNGTACETCHRASGPTHPNQAGPYTNSAHANSLADLRTSSHAGSSCMHCMSTEGFIHQEDDFEVDGPYNPIGCPACHAIHSNWSISGPSQIRAVNATQLCASCHVGSRHTTYNVWYGGTHHLAGVECIDCHGYDYALEGDPSTQFLNHTFMVNPDVACGQAPECHEGLEEWAIGQLESHQSAYNALVEEINTEVEDLSEIVLAYNATEGADHELVAEVMDIIDDVESVVSTQEGDLSEGFHDFSGIMSDLNAAYADLLNAKAYFYENTPPATVTNTVTVTVTTTVTGPGGTLFGMDATLVLIGGSVGGIVIGLILGVLVGRRG